MTGKKSLPLALTLALVSRRRPGRSRASRFFDATNVEVTVKILDGRPVNGHYWVFVTSMTNLPFTLSIQDLGSPLCGPGGLGCPVKVYTAKAGVNENFIDVGSL